jgi:N-acetylglucosaminyldiphosphoundecaprenol N-acetyl-beta-D-mannosaminyltransferase
VVGLDGAVASAVAAVADARTLRIGVINHNKCWLARREAAVAHFLHDAELVVPESSVVWAARILGHGGVEAAWGVALMGRLLEAAGELRWSVYLLGAREDVNRSLAGRFPDRWPGARLVGRHHGYLDDASSERVRTEIVTLEPDLLLVAMGSPLQERFLASLPTQGGARVRLGVGGSFDVHAGLRKDAPAWVRGSGFEWLWRAAQSPRLLRRYLVRNPWFVAAVLREKWTGRVPGAAG